MKNSVFILILLVIAVGVVLGIKNKKMPAGRAMTGCTGGVCTLPIPAGQPVSDDPKVGIPAHQALPSLLELGSVNCVPCKMMAPILDELRETYSGQLDVEFIDIWQDEEAGKQYGIRSIPTQIFLDAEGTELFRHEGFYPREDMVAKWKTLGYGFVKERKAE